MTLVLVDHDPRIRHSLCRVLEDNGHRVRSAATAAELDTLDWLEVDALIADLVMPGNSGVAVVEACRRQRPDLPVVFISGQTGDAPEYPRARFLRKPFGASELLRDLRDLVAGDAGD